MKKFPILFVALASLFLTSCKSGDKAEDVSINDTSANEIIETNNKLIDLSKSQLGNIDRVINYTENVEGKISGRSLVLIPLTLFNMSFNSEKLETIPAAFGKQKDSIQIYFEKTKEKYSSIVSKTDELKSYMSAEDYKDDKGEKAKKITADINKLVDEYFASNNSLFRLTQPIADQAEEHILKDHPLKDYIIDAKVAIKNVEGSYDEIVNQYNNESVNLEALKSNYSKLEAIYKKMNREFKVDDTSYSNKKGYYENFTKEIDEFMGSLRKAQRDIESKKKIEIRTVEEVESAYDDIISKYNNFVS